MAMTVLHNSSTQVSLGELNKSINRLGKALAVMASGQKLNSAADDSASFAISEIMREKIRSLEQDVRNVQNGSAMFRIAQGGIQNIVDELRELKQLAIDAANDSNTDDDRRVLQKMFDQKRDNINDIATATNYNSKRLIDGTCARYHYKVEIAQTDWSKPLRPSIFRPVDEPADLEPFTDTITVGGIYEIPADFTGTINIDTSEPVELRQVDPSTPLSNVEILGAPNGNTNLWIRDLNINTSEPQSIIKFQGSDNVLSVRGKNSLTSTAYNNAVINVGGGLLVQGNGEGSLAVANSRVSSGQGTSGSSYGAGIGSDSGEKLTGDIGIVNVNLKVVSYDGAGIGSGANGGSVGDITIENSTIALNGHYNSSIGSGAYKSSCGDITIFSSTGKKPREFATKITIQSIDTGIGSGYDESNCGNIVIDKAELNINNRDSACVGGGDAANGKNITITRTDLYGKSTHGAGVGTGRASKIDNITIGSETKIVHVSGEGAAVGTGLGGDLASKISISKNSLELLDATNAYVDDTHKFPGVGRGKNGTVNDTAEVEDFEEWSTHLYRGDPLTIHHGTHANEATNFYINHMSTGYLKTAVPNGQDLDMLLRSSDFVRDNVDLIDTVEMLRDTLEKMHEDIDSIKRPPLDEIITAMAGERKYLASVPTFKLLIDHSMATPRRVTASDDTEVPDDTDIAEASEAEDDGDVDVGDETDSGEGDGEETDLTATFSLSKLAELLKRYPTMQSTLEEEIINHELLFKTRDDSTEKGRYLMKGDEATILRGAARKTLDDVTFLGTSDPRLTPVQSSRAALRVIESALTYALEESTNVGAYLERLEFTEENVVEVRDNVQAAESTIRDADMARAMTEYTKQNVLTQAAQSMLAQANQNASGVLSLLQ